MNFRANTKDSFIQACKDGDIERVTLLVKIVDVNVTDNMYKPPIYWAIVKGHYDIVDLLKSDPRYHE